MSHHHPHIGIEADEEDDDIIHPEEIVRVIELDDNDHKDFSDSDENGEGEDNAMETDGPTQVEATSGGATVGATGDDSTVTFHEHDEEPVICARICPVNSEIVVTGGQDNTAWVWNTKDGSVMFECKGHYDTVISAAFNHDGSWVATSDMHGLIQVFQISDGKKIWSTETSEMQWLEWHKEAPYLLGGTTEGNVHLWKVPAGNMKTFCGYSLASCGKILPDGKHACVGYEDGIVKIWDLKTEQAVHCIQGHEGHRSNVISVDHNAAGTLIITGSTDQTAKVINVANGKVVATFKCSPEEDDSVESAVFSKTHDYVVTGTVNGYLKIWDLPTKSLRHACEHKDRRDNKTGVVKILWSTQSDSTFFTGGLDGRVRRYDSRDGKLVRMWDGHCADVMDFDLSRDGSIIVSAGDDNVAKVFQVEEAGR